MTKPKPDLDRAQLTKLIVYQAEQGRQKDQIIRKLQKMLAKKEAK